MAGTTVDNAIGTTVVFATSAFTSSIMGISIAGVTRADIDTSHFGQAIPGAAVFANKTYIPSDLTDGGDLTLEVHFDPDQDLPMNSDNANETITITWPKVPADATAAIWAFDGYMKSFDMTGPLEDKMTATIVVKIAGPITVTVAA